MRPDDFAVLDLTRFELRLRACEATALPIFLGSTLRGAFGHALKKAVCVMNHRNCERCLVTERCLYPYLFETSAPSDAPLLRGQQQAPHPFILTPPIFTETERQNEIASHQSQEGQRSNQYASGARKRLHTDFHTDSDARRQFAAGDELPFDLLLMGRAVEYLNYVLDAISHMAYEGLGFKRARFELAGVKSVNACDIAQTPSSRPKNPACASKMDALGLGEIIGTRLINVSARDTIKLRFLTPTRIRVADHVQLELSFELLVRSLLRRISMLAEVHGYRQFDLDYRALIARAAQVKTRSVNLRWWDLERYSNRQKRKLKIGGFVGEIEYEGAEIEEYLPLIVAGEILYVGAGTSFGLGKYKIENSASIIEPQNNIAMIEIAQPA
jgi:hypothetical protein